MPDHYCTLEDVNALVPQAPFSATSKPGEATVTALIESVAKRMDASLVNAGYTAPVTTGALSLALLREACAWGALGLAQQVRDTGVKTAVTESGRPAKNIWLQQFDDWMKRLCDPTDPFELPDATASDDQVEKDLGDVARSFVESLDEDEFDADNPETTKAQVF